MEQLLAIYYFILGIVTMQKCLSTALKLASLVLNALFLSAARD